MAVPTQEADTLLAKRAEYDSEPEWPSCKGTCMDGTCMLRPDTPQCCYVLYVDNSESHPRARRYDAYTEQAEGDELSEAALLAEEGVGDDQASIASKRVRKEFFCRNDY